jgi:hypothetical protein
MRKVPDAGRRPVAEEKNAEKKGRILRHPAFAQAIRLELERYRDCLEFREEYQLAAEPLRVDMVIIRKAPGVVIEKNIGRIFKRVNIMEYKSPGDSVSFSDFHKVLGYTALYAALNKEDAREMTATIICTRHPRELLKRLAGDGFTVTEESPGIHVVRGYGTLVQIVESKKLPSGENRWLHGLTGGLNTETAGVILEESRNRSGDEWMKAYLYTVFQANAQTMREVMKMREKGNITFDEVLEEFGLTAKWRDEGRVEGAKSAWEQMVGLLKRGYTVDQLEQMVPGSVSTLGHA